MNVLDGIETYVGILATFVVLCLFSLRKESGRGEDTRLPEGPSSRETDDNNNFIYALIRQVGFDSLLIIKGEIEKLKGIHSDCFHRKDNDGKTRLQSAIERARLKDRGTEFEQSLTRTYARYQSIISSFSNEADKKIELFEKKQRMGLKDELTYVALMSLIFVVVVMMVDTMTFIPLSWRALWINMLIACSSPFFVYLYFRFYKSPYQSSSIEPWHSKTWGMRRIVLCAICPFFIWLSVSLVVSVPIISVLLLAPFMGLFYLSANKLERQMEGGADFSRSFILKMSVYFILFAALLSVILVLSQKWTFLYEWGTIHGLTIYLDNANAAVQMLFSVEIAKYAVVLFFSLNIFILPLFLGYFYIQRMTKHLATEIREMFRSSEDAIKDINAAFDKIVLDIDTAVDKS